jgi:hypothetical protein
MPAATAGDAFIYAQSEARVEQLLFFADALGFCL